MGRNSCVENFKWKPVIDSRIGVKDISREYIYIIRIKNFIYFYHNGKLSNL